MKQSIGPTCDKMQLPRVLELLNICGESTERNKAEPTQWAEQSCERCGCKLVVEVQREPAMNGSRIHDEKQR